MNDDARISTEPLWLRWAREIQALAQSGLHFTRDPYDRERYERLRALSAEIMGAHSGLPVERLESVFAEQSGYATPKIDVRGAVFRDGKLLMVREVLDQGRWTLPGGWADVNESPSEAVIKEIREESGFHVRIVKLAAVWDRSRHGHLPEYPFHLWKLFFLCEITGGEAGTSLETSEVAFFGEDELPSDLSQGRVVPHQLRRMFEHLRRPDLPTEFD